MYSRLAKTARDLDHVVALRHPLTDAPAYASVEELAADLGGRRPIARDEAARSWRGVA